MTTYLDRTEARQRLLDAVARDAVRLDHASAQWSVDGSAVGGWDQRTLVELWREGGHIEPLDPPADGSTERVGIVILTRYGKAAHSYWGAPG